MWYVLLSGLPNVPPLSFYLWTPSWHSGVLRDSIWTIYSYPIPRPSKSYGVVGWHNEWTHIPTIVSTENPTFRTQNLCKKIQKGKVQNVQSFLDDFLVPFPFWDLSFRDLGHGLWTGTWPWACQYWQNTHQSRDVSLHLLPAMTAAPLFLGHGYVSASMLPLICHLLPGAHETRVSSPNAEPRLRAEEERCRQCTGFGSDTLSLICYKQHHQYFAFKQFYENSKADNLCSRL